MYIKNLCISGLLFLPIIIFGPNRCAYTAISTYRCSSRGFSVGESITTVKGKST